MSVSTSPLPPPPIIDLVSVNCDEFIMMAAHETPISTAVAEQLTERMRETSNEQTEAGSTLAHYGSAYPQGDITQIHAGGLRLIRDEEGTRFSASILIKQIEGAPPSPPDDFKSFSDLLEITTALLSATEFQCRAEFNYRPTSDLRSRVPLPAPLLLGNSEDFFGFTHTESVVLSQRKKGKLSHKVEVIPQDDGQLTHTVDFVANIPITEEAIQEVFNISSQLSKSLLEQGDDES